MAMGYGVRGPSCNFLPSTGGRQHSLVGSSIGLMPTPALLVRSGQDQGQVGGKGQAAASPSSATCLLRRRSSILRNLLDVVHVVDLVLQRRLLAQRQYYT